MVTQHGQPKGRTANPPLTTPAAIRTHPSQTRLNNGHTRTTSDASLPSPSPRRNSLPGDTSFPGHGDDDDDHHGDDDGGDDHGHLDSHITFLDSLDLDSTSTVDSEEPSPRIKRLCSEPRNRVPAPVLKARYTFRREPREPRESEEQRRRAVSAQSGRSAESRPSTASSVREDADEDEEGAKRGKGPIMELTAGPARRRHRPSLSADVGAGAFEKEEEADEVVVTGHSAMSAWRRKRLETAAAAATAAGVEAAKGVGRKQVARSLSAGDYNKDDEEAAGGKKAGVLEEVANGKDRASGEGAAASGSPGRALPRRVMSTNGLGTVRSVSGLGPARGGGGRSPSPEKGKPPSLIPQRESPQPASEAGRAAIAREEAARESRLRAQTVTAAPPAALDRQRSTSSAGSSASGTSKDPKDPKDRPALRTNIPRPSSIPNSPIKAKLAAYSALASPNRVKSGLTAAHTAGAAGPSPGHGRTRSAVNPGTLQRSASAASNNSATSSAAAAPAIATTTTTSSFSSRLQRSNSGAYASSASASASASTAVSAARKDPTGQGREPPKLRAFKGSLVQPSPIQEASQEDMSRRPGMLATPDDSLEGAGKPSRPSSSHSAIYSPIDPPPETSPQDEEQHQKLLDQLAALRKISRTSLPSSNRSSWSTESAEDAESADPKPRTRRRSNKHKGVDDPAAASARVDEIIAEIDSLHKDRNAVDSPPRLSRSKSLDDSVLRAAGKETTPPRPRSAGKGANLVTPTKLFSPDSEMGEFTARLLRSPAVEDYEDLLAPDSDKEGDDSILPQRERAPSVPEKHTATTASTDDIDALPRPPKEIIKREIIKTGRPRKEIIKTAIIKTERPRPAVKYPKRSILEDGNDSDDSLDYLISNDQDFSALLNTEDTDSGSGSESSSELLANGAKYAPEQTQKVRSKDEAHIADREREKERAVHEKLMNRLKTLQLEVRSATRGIEVLEQWLKSPSDSETSNGGDDDIVGRISEHEALLARLRIEEAKHREKLQMRVSERKRTFWGRIPTLPRWAWIVLFVALFWYSVESAILYVFPVPEVPVPS